MIDEQHSTIPQSRPLAPARGKMAGDLVGPGVREFPPPRRDGDLHTLKRHDLGSTAWHRPF
jgi:hypothetical protein